MRRETASRCALLLLATLVGCAPKRDSFWIAGDVQLGPKHEALLGGELRPLRTLPGIVNLEGPIAPGASYTYRGGSVQLRNRFPSPTLLRRAGVRVAGLANNHALDLGEGGLRRTENLLRSAGIRPAREGKAAELMISERSVGVVAFDLTSGVPDDLARALRAAVQAHDLVVALFHTGGPPSYLPSRPLQEAVALALASGVRVIAAHGTHALARVERRGKALIAWGLGNLAFDCPCSREEEGLILRVQLRSDGTLAAEAIPIAVGLAGKPARHAPYPDELLALLNGLGSSPKLRAHGIGAPF